MFLVDDILFFPANSIFWIFREVYNAAQQEVAGEAQRITAQMTELYMMLETGKISEEEFSAREKTLLDRLDEIQEHGTVVADEDGEKRKNGRAGRGEV